MLRTSLPLLQLSLCAKYFLIIKIPTNITDIATDRE